MIFLDGREFTGKPPGLRTVQRGPLMLVYLTDVRGERVVIIQGGLDRLTQAVAEAPHQRRWPCAAACHRLSPPLVGIVYLWNPLRIPLAQESGGSRTILRTYGRFPPAEILESLFSV